MVSISDTVERPLWTAEEFLEWLKPEVRADLVDGERMLHSPVNFRPARLQPTFAAFAPTLVVEATSSATAHLDTGTKFAAYEEHGVQEYWILDPERLAHRSYRRDGELLVEFAANAGRIPAQTIPGFWLDRSWLDPGKLPEVGRCLAEILADDGASPIA